MSNFYGKRFLSSLLGALSVLGSPVASAGKRSTRNDTLGSGKSSSRRRTNRNVKRRRGGKIKSNRKVKSIGGLKKVLKETGGKVVGVSPDGKGGFVAFVETPTGIVTVTIVGVPLLVVLSLVACRVFSGRANVFESASGALLETLFKNDKGRYGSFVEKLFEKFFSKSGTLGKEFDDCGKNLDEFLKVVFGESSFVSDGIEWKFGNGETFVNINFGKNENSRMINGFPDMFVFYRTVFDCLYEMAFFKISGLYEADWGDKISAVLFAFWCSVEYNLGFDYSKDEIIEVLKAKENLVSLSGAFAVISNYVRSLLESAGRDYNGQKKGLDDGEEDE